MKYDAGVRLVSDGPNEDSCPYMYDIRYNIVWRVAVTAIFKVNMQFQAEVCYNKFAELVLYTELVGN